ncbi:hypothetical protein [Candidatus Uabimicrobium amorphum]|uniref:Pilus assembly protein PilM n=1 Tax=Uabimicrobium amorphum TaxID=2596890 RepID=A0A5S9IK19_UABAM|nr:hypothetical protein [Candidatus Uabimicrobium amorphum]BBM82971.1 pilus assembly protein PilM [Candidatus Uabimicrobium amorphum]
MAENLGVGIQVSENCLRIAKIKTSDKSTSLLNACEFELPISQNDKFSEETATKFCDFLQGQNVKISSAVIGISGENVNIRYVKIPPGCPVDRIQHLVEMDVEQISEKSRTSLSYDFTVATIPQKAPVAIVVMVRNSFLDLLSDFFKKAKVKIDFFVPCAFGLYQFFLKYHDIQPQKKYCLVDVDRHNLNLAVLDFNELWFMRNLNINDGQDASFETKDDYKLVEIDLTSDDSEEEIEETVSTPSPISGRAVPDLIDASIKFAALQTSVNLQVDQLFLSGERSRERSLRESVLKKIGCPVVHLSVKALETHNLPGASGPFFQKFSHNFFVPIGIAKIHANKKDSIIQIVSERKKTIEKLIREKLFVYTSVALTLIFVCFSIIYVVTTRNYYENIYQNMEKRYKGYQQREQKIKTTLKQNAVLRDQFSLLHSYVNSNKHFFEMMDFLHSQLPESMYLTELDFNTSYASPTTVRISGVIEESFIDVYTILDDFRSKLKKIPIVTEIKDKDPRLNEEEGKLSFEIEIRVTGK